MNQTLLIILIVAVVAIFSFILLFDGSSKRRRQDDRDADKADDIQKNPALLNRSQQAAELQVGEDRERVQASRFQPDAKENQRPLPSE
jgi:FtsZ-interacting cell division protein ZipA